MEGPLTTGTIWAHLQNRIGDPGYPDQIQKLVAELTDPVR